LFKDIISVLFEGNIITERHFYKKIETEKKYSNGTYVILVVAKTFVNDISMGVC
jgi:hypothetical protein